MTVRVVKKSDILCYFSGVALNKAHFFFKGMKCKAFGPPYLRVSMIKMRYKILLNCLRFNDKVKEGENSVNEGNISFQYFFINFLNLWIEGDHWGDLGVDGWIILGWISRRWDVGI